MNVNRAKRKRLLLAKLARALSRQGEDRRRAFEKWLRDYFGAQERELHERAPPEKS